VTDGLSGIRILEIVDHGIVYLAVAVCSAKHIAVAIWKQIVGLGKLRTLPGWRTLEMQLLKARKVLSQLHLLIVEPVVFGDLILTVHRPVLGRTETYDGPVVRGRQTWFAAPRLLTRCVAVPTCESRKLTADLDRNENERHYERDSENQHVPGANRMTHEKEKR
jgi:hypothetical protein